MATGIDWPTAQELCRDNRAATTDPGVSNDVTQGYIPGSFWLNTSNSRMWCCLSNAAGAATWYIDGVVPGVGIEPSSMLTQFGSGTMSFPEEGNIFRYASGGASPATTGSDIVMQVLTIPANTFDGVGNRGITISAQGSFANNTNVKTTKIIFNPTTAVVGSTVGTGGTTVATSGAYSTTGLIGWYLAGSVFKYGAANSNTQIVLPQAVVIGTSHSGLGAGAGTAGGTVANAVENAAILVAITGNAATTATDIILYWCEINAMN